MGIIAGIYTKSDNSKLDSLLDKMIKIQIHRDNSKPIVFTNSSIAVGMANKHDMLYCHEDEKSDLQKHLSHRKSGLYAFVDGIVLSISNHRVNLTNNENQGAIPLCSNILASNYEKWGLDFVDYIEGEFACAIWDNNSKRLVLARDPYGHKPLFYYRDNEQFIFSSEIKGILETGINREIDLISLNNYLSLNCVPYPSTIFKNIRQVPPGSMLIFEKDEVAIKKYWEPKIVENPAASLDNAIEMIAKNLKSAVKKRMVTDKTFCFLSGGIDSSAILSFASEIAGTKVHAISVGFEEAEDSELEDAETMAKHVGAVHHQVIATRDSFFEMLDTLVFHHDSPFSDTSAYPSYFAGKLGRQFTDIILTGDGPDQSMGGSGHHVFAIENGFFKEKNREKQMLADIGAKLIAKVIKSPEPSLLSKIQRKLYRYSVSPIHSNYDLRSYFPDIVKKYLCTDELLELHRNYNPFNYPEKWFKEAGNVDDINKYLYADMKFYVPDDLMVKVDRMCMAHGLETLSPFQDIHLSKIVNTLPGHFKINMNNNTTTKYILKKVCENRFPDETLAKKKKGFGIPLEKWLKEDKGKRISDILLDEKTLRRGYFKKKSIEQMVNTFIDGRGDYFYPGPNTISSLLTLEIWHRRYIDI